MTELIHHCLCFQGAEKASKYKTMGAFAGQVCINAFKINAADLKSYVLIQVENVKEEKSL